MAVDAATWLVSAALLLGVRIPAREPTAAGEETSFVAELKEGWAVFTGYTWLWVIVLAFGLLNAIHAGAWFTLGPAVAKDTIGERGWGYVLSAEAIGVLAMTVVLTRVHLRRPLLVGMLGMAVFSVPLFILGTNPVLPLLVVGAFAAGVGIEVFGLGWNLAMQENIDERLLSRAYSYDALGSFVAIPIGQLTFGPLAEKFGAQDVMVVAAVVYLLIALSTLLSRSVRRLERVSPTSRANARMTVTLREVPWPRSANSLLDSSFEPWSPAESRACAARPSTTQVSPGKSAASRAATSAAAGAFLNSVT